MKSEKICWENSNISEAYDDLPFWSASFGLSLLENIKMKKNLIVLDVGCGTGFPLLEVAERLGSTCKVFGVDPWKAAIEKIERKTATKNIKNVWAIQGFAENLPFQNELFDLIISNNGISVVKDKAKVLSECFRVCKPNGQFVFTVVLPGTMCEFYEVLKEVIKESGNDQYETIVDEHILAKRKPVSYYQEELKNIGFKVRKVEISSFKLRFLDGSSLLNYFFIRLNFLDGWKSILDHCEGLVLLSVENKLNQIATRSGQIELTIPFACIDCERLN